MASKPRGLLHPSIRHSRFFILHSQFSILNSPFSILNSSVYSGRFGFSLHRHRGTAGRRQDGTRRTARRPRSTRPPSSKRPTTRSWRTSTRTGPAPALQAQLFFLLNRHRQQVSLRQADLFSQVTICDYLFEKDRIYAYLNLDDNELFIYQRLYDLLARDVSLPDLVVYLQAPIDVLREAARARRDEEQQPYRPNPEYIRKLNEAYQHFFFHYTATPLLVVETSQFDVERQRRGARRPAAPDPRHGQGHPVLRAADVGSRHGS